MKNFLKTKLRLVAIAFAAVVMCVCAAFAGVTLNQQSASAMTTSSVTNVYSGADIWNSSKSKFDKKGVQDLLVKLGKGAGATTDTKSYKALESAYSAPVTATTIATKNGGANGLVVTLGGYKWTVTYLSTDSNGDLIATLWYADTETNSVFAGNASGTGWYSSTTSGGYSGYKYSNHYGGSYMRAVTLGNGGQFYSSNSNNITDSSVSTVTATEAQVQGSKFNLFAQGAIAEYLDTPSMVSWQQQQYNSAFSSYRLQNDNLTAVTANWYNTNISNSVKNDPLYYQWGNDKVWLPSIPETGWNTSNTGIWGTTTEQRKSTSSSSYSWLRSGYDGGARDAYVLYSSGDYSNYSTNNSHGVRPALHLNLKSAAKAAGVSVPTVTTADKTYTAAAINAIDNIEEDKVDISATHADNVTNTPAAWTPTVADGALKATQSGDYEVTFSLKNPYTFADVEWNADEEAWVHKTLKDEDGTSPLVVPAWDADGVNLDGNQIDTEAAYEILIKDITLKFTIKRAPITATWSGGTNFKWKYDGTAKEPTLTLSGEKSTEKVVLVTDFNKVGTDDWTSSAPINSGKYTKRIKLAAVSSNAVNANYVLNSGTADVEDLSQEFEIEPTYLTVQWFGKDGGSTFSWVFNDEKFTPTAKVYMPNSSEATTAVLAYEYALQSGETGTLEADGSAPKHAGKYVVTVKLAENDANLNFGFAESATVTRNFEITRLSAKNLQWWQNSGFTTPWGSGITFTYDNAGHRPYATAEDLSGNSLAMTFKFQRVESGSLVGEQFTDTPKQAGTYRITAYEQHDDYTMSGAGTTYINYTINKRSVAVNWDWSGFTEKRTEYSASAQAPAASAKAENIWSDDGSASGDYTLVLTSVVKLGGVTQVNGAVNYNSSPYNIKVSLSDEDAKNYTLTDDNQNFYIDKYTIKASEIHWYNGGKEVSPVNLELTFGAAPALSAKAIYTINGNTVEIDLVPHGTNGYDHYPTNVNDVWPQGAYTFTVELKSADAANLTANASDLVVKFNIVPQRVQAEEMHVVWVIRNADGSYTQISANYKFVYNGQKQYPTALGYYVNEQTENPFDITDSSTYKVLKTVGTSYIDAGTYTAWANPGGNPDLSFYVEDGSDEIVYEIAPLEVEVEWTVAAKYTYNGSAQGPSLAPTSAGSAALGGLSANFNTLLKVSQAVDAGDQIAKASAGKNYALKLAGETAEETLYKAFYINKLTLTSAIKWESGEDKDVFVYDGAEHAPAYTLDALYSSLKIEITGKQTAAGTYYVTAVLTNDPANRNYEIASANAVKQFTIKQKEVAVIWTDNAGDTFKWSYDGAKHEPSASVAPVTLADGTTVNLTVTVTGGEINAGSYSATASIADKNYALTDSEQPFTIEKAKITVTAADKSVTYGQNAPQFTATASGAIASTDSASDLVKGVQFRCAYGQFSEVKTGGYTITPYGLDLANYEVTYANGTLTVNKAAVTVSVQDHNGTYGDHFHSPTYTASGVVNGDSLGITFEIWETDENGAATQKVADLTKAPAAGTYLIKAVVSSANANYDLGTIADAKYIIAKKSLVVSADNITIEYGDAKPVYTVSVSGLVNGDSAPAFVAASDYDPADPDNKNAGTYDITVTAQNLDNYEVATADYNKGTLTVEQKKITVQISSHSVVYGAAGADLTADGSWTVTNGALVNGDTNADLGITLEKADNGLNGSTAVSGNVVGVYDITGKSTSTNYSVEFKNGTYVITKATLTVTANDDSITYGDALPADFSVAYSGFVNGDNENASGVWVAGKGTAKFNCPYTAGSGVGTYLITPYGLEANNYDIVYETGDLTVEQLAISIAIENSSSKYGDPMATLNFRVASGSVYGSDNLGITLTKAEDGLNGTTPVSGLNVGTYEITGTASNPNYKVTFTNKGTYTVSKATLVVKANSSTIIYGDENISDSWANGVSFIGFVNGDTDAVISGDVVYSYNYSRYDKVGKYSITPGGLTAENYDITFEDGELTVEKKAVTVTIEDKTSMYGKPEVALTHNGADVALNGDDLEITLKRGRDTVKDAGAYVITGTASNENYVVTFLNGTYTITPFEIEVIWKSGNADDSDFNYTYNAKMQAPKATFLDWDNNEKTLTVSGGRTRAGTDFTAEAVLPAPTSNFVFKTGTDVTQLFTINPKSITIQWYKNYDKETDTYSGLISASAPCEYDFKSGVKQVPFAVAQGLESGDNVNIVVVGAAVAAGKYTAEAVISDTAGNGNYIIGAATKTCEFSIVTVAASGFAWYKTADLSETVTSGNLAYVYDGHAHRPWIKSGVDDKYSYVITKADGSDCGGVALNVGSYKIVATPIDQNITITAQQATFNFEITAKTVTVNWNATSFVYNGGVQIPAADFTDVFGNRITLTVTVDGGNENSVEAATYKAKVELAANGNYKFENGFTAEQSYTITAKKIEVVWTSKLDGNSWIMEYNGTEVDTSKISATATMKNEIAGENIKLVHTLLLNGKPVSNIKDAGIYTIKVELATENGNYEIIDGEHTFEITKPSLTITADNFELDYGAAKPEFTAQYNGFISGENEDILGLEVDGKINWLYSEYNQNSSPRDEGYAITLVTMVQDPVAREAFESILKNYDWKVVPGLITILVGEGDVKLIGTYNSSGDMIYNGGEQLPKAYYKSTKSGNENWIALNVTLMTDGTYTSVSTDPAVDVNVYYIKVSKYDNDNDETPLTKNEWTFEIKKLELTVNISDSEEVYGDVTQSNYESKLSWEYGNLDDLLVICNNDRSKYEALRERIERDNLLETTVGATLSYDDGGFANAGEYHIYGIWSQDEDLRKNYNVKFVGSAEASDGSNSEGLFVIEKAVLTIASEGTPNQISKITGDPIIVDIGKLNENKETLNEFKYEYIRNSGYADASLSIRYRRYNLETYNIDDIAAPEDEKNYSVDNSPFEQKIGKWLVNFEITMPNHEIYYGQWIIYIEPSSNEIRITFVKNYEVNYGDTAVTGKELTKKLLDGYIEIDKVLTKEDFAKYATAKVSYSRDLSLAGVGEYTIEFVFDEIPNSTVVYVADYVNATNVGAYAVKPRLLTVDWGETDFVYDGSVKLSELKPKLGGWINGETIELGGLEVGAVKTYSFTDNGTSGIEITVTAEEKYDFVNNGGHQLTVRVNNPNYTLDIDNAAKTVSISLDGEPTVLAGLPDWLIWVIVAIAAVSAAIIAFVIIYFKKKKSATDDDGFYENVENETAA